MKAKIEARMIVGLRNALLCTATMVVAASVAQAPPHAWHAQWIAAADGPARDYDVVYFRRQLVLPTLPEH